MIKKKFENIELKELKEELKSVRLQMKINDGMFNLASDEYLVESIIFEKMSLNARHSFLVSKIKEHETEKTKIKV